MNSGHISRSFDEDLQCLQDLVSNIFDHTRAQFIGVLSALQNGDIPLAEEIAKRDKAINLLEDEILAQAMQIIVKRQPMANDLRAITASIRIASFAERMCDHCKNIAGRVDMVRDAIDTDHGREILAIGAMITHEIDTAFLGYRTRNLETCFQVMPMDKQVDQHYKQLWDNVIAAMGGADNDTNQAHTHMILIGKHLERIGDLCKDVSKVTYFVVSGDEFRQFKLRRKAAKVKNLWQFYQSEATSG